MHTDMHASIHPDIHRKSVSLAPPYRLGSNLRSRRRGLATCALGARRKCQSVCLGRAGHPGEHTHDVNCLSRPVSLCLVRAGHTDEHTHDVNNAVPRDVDSVISSGRHSRHRQRPVQSHIDFYPYSEKHCKAQIFPDKDGPTP